MKELRKRPLRLIVSITLMLQAVLAILFVLNQSGTVPEYRDTFLYLQYADSLRSDGWHPILYALILRVFKSLEVVTGIPYQGWVYSLQTAVMLVAASILVSTVSLVFYHKKTTLTFSLAGAIAVITYPPLMQLNICILPISFACSFATMVFSCSVMLMAKAYSEEKVGIKTYIAPAITICILTFLTGITERHIFYGLMVWLIFIILNCFCEKLRKKQLVTAMVLVLALFTGLLAGVIDRNTKKQENLVYMPYSILNDTTDRFVFPRLYADYSSYPNDVQQVFTREVAEICTGHYEYYLNSIGPMIHMNESVEADHIWKEMIQVGIVNRTKELAVSSLRDGADALFPTVAMAKMLFYNENSYYGYHISRMWKNDSELTSLYFGYGSVVNLVITITATIFLVIEIRKKRQNRKQGAEPIISFRGRFAVAVVAMVILQGFSAVIFQKMGFDFHHCSLNLLLWEALIIPAVIGYRLKGNVELK